MTADAAGMDTQVRDNRRGIALRVIVEAVAEGQRPAARDAVIAAIVAASDALNRSTTPLPTTEEKQNVTRISESSANAQLAESAKKKHSQNAVDPRRRQWRFKPWHVIDAAIVLVVLAIVWEIVKAARQAWS